MIEQLNSFAPIQENAPTNTRKTEYTKLQHKEQLQKQSQRYPPAHDRWIYEAAV
jgi:hypothetical protein